MEFPVTTEKLAKQLQVYWINRRVEVDVLRAGHIWSVQTEAFVKDFEEQCMAVVAAIKSY